MIAEPLQSMVDFAQLPKPHPTVWGLDPVQLHDHFWAARGVFVVRLGEQKEIPRDAELYLLTEPHTLTIFRIAPLIDSLSWVKPIVMVLRLISRQDQGYRETVVTDENGRFVRFRRLYGGAFPRFERVAFTRDPNVAYAWQKSADSRLAWKQLRREARTARCITTRVSGRAYDRRADQEVSRFVTDLVRYWKNPSATIAEVSRVSPNVWGNPGIRLNSNIDIIGPVWIGAGRSIEAGTTVVGPAVLWDDPETRPQSSVVRWSELEPSQVLATVRRKTNSSRSRGARGKRLFDIVFAIFVLLLTAPLYPLVMLAIWFEDGRPFFFAHPRETIAGREFPCLKFRSMRKDAERIKAALAAANQADGPQFYISQDPRLTRVGRFIRRMNIDELPQFINVLLGHMSIVGPRPSPRSENQFSPAWREARLSTRAGVTGLWQVCRTRRPGLDFQEWIKYDLEYVHNACWRLDLSIIFRTIRILMRG